MQITQVIGTFTGKEGNSAMLMLIMQGQKDDDAKKFIESFK